MKRLDTYDAATAGSAPADYGLVANESAPGNQDGTPIDATLINDVYYSIYAALVAAGITPSGAVEDTADSDFLLALQGLGKQAAYNPFLNYALFKDEKAAGVAADAATNLVFTKRLLTESVNNIVGASVAAGAITLPAGTYVIKGYGDARRSTSGAAYTQAGVFLGDSASVGDILIAGSSDMIYTDNRPGDGLSSKVVGSLTLVDTAVITFRQWANGCDLLGVGNTSGIPVCHGALEIWKID